MDRTERTRRRWILTSAFVVGVSAAVWVALHLHAPAEVTPATLGGDGRYRPVQPTATQAADLTPGKLLGSLAMRSMDTLPADLPMPLGAERHSIVARTAAGIEQIKAEYAVHGQLAQVAERYGRQLAALGWHSVPSVSTGRAGDGRRMNYHKSADTLTVRLNSDGIWVKITAVLGRAGRN